MEKLTITEGLAEITLIKKKLLAKQSKIKDMLTRVEHLPDVFEKEGGSQEVVGREMQGISDLVHRLIRIRAAISKANLLTLIVIADDQGDKITMTIHDWLIWKREAARDFIGFVAGVNKSVRAHMENAGRQPQVYKDEAGNVQVAKIKINLDYPAWLALESSTTDRLQKLDGQLSLKNATVVIEF